MKIASIIGLVLLLGGETWLYLDAYWDGALSPRPIFSPDDAVLGALIVAGAILLVLCWVLALIRKKNRLWTTSIASLVIAVMVICWVTIGTPYDLTVRTMQDRISKVSTLDDLRAFAQAVTKDSPEILHSSDKSLDLSKEQIAVLGKEPKYFFLLWKRGNSGPIIRIVNGGVVTFWTNGSEIYGVGVNLTGDFNSDRGYYSISRPSKDVYFFESE